MRPAGTVMRASRRLLAIALGVGTVLAVAGPARPADAHPLGNFSVNQLESLDLYPNRIEVHAIVDIAELPTLQERSLVDRDGTGAASVAERAGYATATCARLARDFAVAVSQHRLMWTIKDRSFRYARGSAGLDTSRLDCRLRAPARLGSPATVHIANHFRADRIGWRELTAVGHGVQLVDSPLATRSISNGLRAYPRDLLRSALDERSARLRTQPGAGAASAARPAAAAPARGGSVLTRWTATAERALHGRLAGGHLAPLTVALAMLLALALGAGHAALPGHGKTVMALYLAGRAGRVRDAVAVAATVTLTHTGGVLLFGVLLSTVSAVSGESVLGYLGVASGALVALVGAAMLTRARHHRASHANQHHHHEHPHRPSRLTIAGIGVAGGLVPSPSALIILLAAVGLGRTGLGIVLVVCYGLGMAGALTAAGAALILLRGRWRRARPPRWVGLAARLSTLAPTATAALVLLVGLGLTGRALTGIG